MAVKATNTASTRVIAKVPASTANLGPGFDTLGMALNLFTWFELQAAETTTVQLYGDRLQGLPRDKSNLVYKVAQSLFAEAGCACPELAISMYSEAPLDRGLGSSASAIVGSLTAANAMMGSPFTPHDLFQRAVRIERHPDNVGASLFGGIIAASWDGEAAECVRMEADPRLEALVAIPDFPLATEKARAALPAQVPLKDAVFNVGRASLLVAALSTGNLSMIRHAMQDALHQPYRSALVPGMARILGQACDYGALGIALSGAGPTLLALADGSSPAGKQSLERFLRDAFASEGIAAETLWLKPCAEGARILTHLAENSTFIENIKGEVRA